MDHPNLEFVIYIRTTPELLWRALTLPEYTRQYWAATSQESNWKPGGSWRIMTPDGRVADSGEILEIEAPRRLRLSWRNELFPEARAEGYSHLTYELEAMGEMVKFRLLHEFEKRDSKLRAGVADGWPLILSSLKSLLETGASLEVTRHWPKGI